MRTGLARSRNTSRARRKLVAGWELWLMDGSTVVLRFVRATGGVDFLNYEGDTAGISFVLAEGGVDADGRPVTFDVLFTESGARAFTDIGFRQTSDSEPLLYGLEDALARPWRMSANRVHRFEAKPVGRFTPPVAASVLLLEAGTELLAESGEALELEAA